MYFLQCRQGGSRNDYNLIIVSLQPLCEYIIGYTRSEQGIQMGILKLMDFLKQRFPQTIVSRSIADYRGRTVAIDASNWIYQFLIKTQSIKGDSISTPTDSQGNHTGHLIGIMSRVAFCFENNVHAVWVFDGKPPKEKANQLRRRKSLKQSAQMKTQEARNSILQGDQESTFDLLKMTQRSMRIGQGQKQSAMQLLKLIGVPVVQSPSEAEPQCSQLVKQGLAYGAVTEDMDTLAFGCPRLIRYFGKEGQCVELNLAEILQQSGLSYEQFVDLCILCGCDYSSRIRNVGPIKAYQLLAKHKNIQNILQHIASDDKLYLRHTYDDEFNYFAARRIFKQPEVLTPSESDLQRGQFQKEALVQFLNNKQFSETRIKNWIERVLKSKYMRK